MRVGARPTCGERCAARQGLPVCEGVGEEAGRGLSLFVLGGVRVGVLSVWTCDVSVNNLMFGFGKKKIW